MKILKNLLLINVKEKLFHRAKKKEYLYDLVWDKICVNIVMFAQINGENVNPEKVYAPMSQKFFYVPCGFLRRCRTGEMLSLTKSDRLIRLSKSSCSLTTTWVQTFVHLQVQCRLVSLWMRVSHSAQAYSKCVGEVHLN